MVCSAGDGGWGEKKLPGKYTSTTRRDGHNLKTTVRGEILINLWLQSEVDPQAAAAVVAAQQQLENEIFKCKHSFFTSRGEKETFQHKHVRRTWQDLWD